jgi:hypothetical protein
VGDFSLWHRLTVDNRWCRVIWRKDLEIGIIRMTALPTYARWFRTKPKPTVMSGAAAASISAAVK